MSTLNNVQLPCDVRHHLTSFLCADDLISYTQTCHSIRSDLDLGIVLRALARPVSKRSLSISPQKPGAPKLWSKLDLIPIGISSFKGGAFVHSISCRVQFSIATTHARVWIQDSDDNIRASGMIQKHPTESWIWTIELSFQLNEDEMNPKDNITYSLWYQGVDCKRGYSLYAKDIQFRAFILDGIDMAKVYNSFAFYPSSILLNNISLSNPKDSWCIENDDGNDIKKHRRRCKHAKNALMSYKFGNDGFNLLHQSCVRPCAQSLSEEWFECIKVIVELGGKEFVRQGNDFGETSLHVAVDKRLSRVVHFLIQTCGEECLTMRNNKGKTPLDTVVQLGPKKDLRTREVLRLLLNVIRVPGSEKQKP